MYQKKPYNVLLACNDETVPLSEDSVSLSFSGSNESQIVCWLLWVLSCEVLFLQPFLFCSQSQMAAVVQPPLNLVDPGSTESLLALSLAHLVKFFDSYELKDGELSMELANPKSDNELDKEEDTNKEELQSIASTIPKPLPKVKIKAEEEPKTERNHWFRRVVTMRFGTWSERKVTTKVTTDDVFDHNEPHTETAIGKKDSATHEEVKDCPKMSPNAATLPQKLSNFRPSRSRSLTGRSLAALFIRSQMSTDRLEASVFLPYNHQPTLEDFPSITDVEDMSAAKIEYSTLPAEWNGYKHEALRSSDEELEPRTKWGEWRNAKRRMQMLKGKLKLSIALGKKRTKGLKVRFLSPSEGLNKLHRPAGTVEEDVFSPISGSDDFERLF